MPHVIRRRPACYNQILSKADSGAAMRHNTGWGKIEGKMMTKRMLTAVWLLMTMALPLLLGSCAGLLGPRDVELPLAKLQTSINKRFPVKNRYLEVFDISLTNPQLTLMPDTNRIQIAIEASIAPPFTSKRWNGSMALSGALRFDVDRNAIMLVEPHIEQLKLDGVDPAQSRQFSKLGTVMADKLFRDTPLYRFKPEDLRYGGTNFVPSKIIVTSNALVVTFDPVK
jgi:hypothetical protein